MKFSCHEGLNRRIILLHIFSKNLGFFGVCWFGTCWRPWEYLAGMTFPDFQLQNWFSSCLLWVNNFGSQDTCLHTFLKISLWFGMKKWMKFLLPSVYRLRSRGWDFVRPVTGSWIKLFKFLLLLADF